MNPRGLFLDLDGTLADSLGVMRLAYGAFLAEHGAQGTDAEFTALNGPPLGEVVRRLARTHGLEGPQDRLLARYGAAVDRLYAEVPPHIGSAALLAAARAAGAAVAVVTSNGRARTEAWLHRTGLRPSIDLLICGEDVGRGKPDPEPYLLALERSGLEAADVVAVEDSAQGLAAAAAAGLRTAALVPPGAGPPPGSAPTLTIGRLDALVPLLFPQT